MPPSDTLPFDPFELVTETPREADPGVRWFTADPAVLYPAMVKRIRAALAEEPDGSLASRLGVPQELVGADHPDADPLAAGRRLAAAARKMGDRLDLALEPFSDAQKWEDWERADRNAALELCRLWFTRALQLAVGGPAGLRITKNDAYKLS